MPITNHNSIKHLFLWTQLTRSSWLNHPLLPIPAPLNLLNSYNLRVEPDQPGEFKLGGELVEKLKHLGVAGKVVDVAVLGHAEWVVGKAH